MRSFFKSRKLIVEDLQEAPISWTTGKLRHLSLFRINQLLLFPADQNECLSITQEHSNRQKQKPFLFPYVSSVGSKSRSAGHAGCSTLVCSPAPSHTWFAISMHSGQQLSSRRCKWKGREKKRRENNMPAIRFSEIFSHPLHLVGPEYREGGWWLHMHSRDACPKSTCASSRTGYLHFGPWCTSGWCLS